MKGMRDAVLEMIAQCLLLDAVQGRAYCADLGQDVDAVAAFLDHARDATHLAFDATQAGKLGFLKFVVHTLTIPLEGI